MYNTITWAVSEDRGCDFIIVFPHATDHATILPTVPTDNYLANLVLCMRVSLQQPLLLCCGWILCRMLATAKSCTSSGYRAALPQRSTQKNLADNVDHRFIPGNWRPAVWVRVLPALENIFYGANLSNMLSAHKSVVLDILAWLPYGLIHFGAPAVCSIIIFIFAPPKTVPVFARAFGYMNLIGVAIQILFPCSPPWYENMYGLAPANYSMKGSPAGLARIDLFLGVDLYTSKFTASPMPFGAFPSLHAGNATIEALFMSHVFPKLRPLFIAYTLWVWWATMYLSHHYAVDLVGGSLLAGVVFYFAKARFLPRVQSDKFLRWDYDFVEVGDSSAEYGYGLAGLDKELNVDSDEWTVGSSSSISSGSLSPVDENQSLWEGETLVSHSDHETPR